MNLNYFFSVLMTVLLFYSCSSDQKRSGNGDDDMTKISNLTCEAIQLRKARFALADSMRAYQDSLLRSSKDNTPQKAKQWETELEAMELRKIRLTTQSRDLADTIRTELAVLTREMTTEEKRTFNKRLQAKTEDLNCQ